MSPIRTNSSKSAQTSAISQSRRTFVPSSHSELYEAIMTSSLPTSIRRQPQKQSSSSHVKRPRNGFIIFRSYVVSRLKSIPADSPAASLIERDNCKISCIVGDWWRELDGLGREPWFLLADAEKEEHLQMHPNYVYTPKAAVPAGERREKRGRKKMTRSDPQGTKPLSISHSTAHATHEIDHRPEPSFSDCALLSCSKMPVPSSPSSESSAFSAESTPLLPDHVSDCSASGPASTSSYDLFPATPSTFYDSVTTSDFDPDAPFNFSPSSFLGSPRTHSFPLFFDTTLNEISRVGTATWGIRASESYIGWRGWVPPRTSRLPDKPSFRTQPEIISPMPQRGSHESLSLADWDRLPDSTAFSRDPAVYF